MPFNSKKYPIGDAETEKLNEEKTVPNKINFIKSLNDLERQYHDWIKNWQLNFIVIVFFVGTILSNLALVLPETTLAKIIPPATMQKIVTTVGLQNLSLHGWIRLDLVMNLFMVILYNLVFVYFIWKVYKINGKYDKILKVITSAEIEAFKKLRTIDWSNSKDKNWRKATVFFLCVPVQLFGILFYTIWKYNDFELAYPLGYYTIASILVQIFSMCMFICFVINERRMRRNLMFIGGEAIFPWIKNLRNKKSKLEKILFSCF